MPQPGGGAISPCSQDGSDSRKTLSRPLRLIAAAAGPERHDRAAAIAIGANGVEETTQPQFGDLVAQVLQRSQLGMMLGLLAERCS